MADGLTVDNGALTDYDIATDEVDVNGQGVKHVQYVKIVAGQNGATDPVDGTSDGAMRVITHRLSYFQQVTSAGLTTATTAYSAGDQVGTMFSFTNAVRATGGFGRIKQIVLHDEQDIIGPYEVVLFRNTATLASDNAAFAVSDADANLIICGIPLTGATDYTNNRIAQALQLDITYQCTGDTTLRAALICRAGHSFFSGGVGSLKLDIWAELD